MPSPSIHEFQLREVVNYEQLNSNFSNIVNAMLKYEEGIVNSYDSTSRETEVLLSSGSIITLLNYTPFNLVQNDEIYIYYWTDIETDGYVGYKKVVSA